MDNKFGISKGGENELPKRIKYNKESVKRLFEYRRQVETAHKELQEHLRQQSKGMTEKQMHEIVITC